MGKPLSRQVKKAAAVEKKGPYGVWRREFCRKYTDLLARARHLTQQALADRLASNGESITCRRGCVHCCYHYVAVSLAHGMVIVDFLYKKPELLKQFLDNFAKWRGRGFSISNHIDQIRNQSLSASMPIDRIIAETRPLSGQYKDMHVACPFLSGKNCMIYDVRPLSCSGHYAASPPEWCSPESKKDPVVHHVSPHDEDLTEILRLADPRLILYELTLPKMIHRLLTQGASPLIAQILGDLNDMDPLMT